jgi:rhodanese-related sulfurtransferase
MDTLEASVETPVRRVFPSETGTESTLLLDVRTPAEFEEAHIEGSVLHRPIGLRRGGPYHRRHYGYLWHGHFDRPNALE